MDEAKRKGTGKRPGLGLGSVSRGGVWGPWRAPHTHLTSIE
jgi:hypothetical protein